MIECVPNISEGRNLDTVKKIVSAVEIPGIQVLHVDSGFDPNRTVITFVGSQEAVAEAAFCLIERASQLIDMRRQQGTHPRIGATDVCPLVPLTGSDMAECRILSEEIAKRVARELGIPVYLYEHSARIPERKLLARIRHGQFEGLGEKMKRPEWEPDYGPQMPHPTAGACVVGARDLLVAFNINLSTKSLELGRKIASAIREHSIDSDDGLPCLQLQGVRAIAWDVPELGSVQISTNITNYRRAGVYEVFSAAKTLAHELGVEVLGSELIGMIPLDGLLDVTKKTVSAERFHLMSEPERIRHAHEYLGLSEFKPFKAKDRILEYRLRNS